jgi:hypothetical protein
MKKIIFLIAANLLILFSCSKNEETLFDESIYFDNDANCEESFTGNCCDVDGRVIVIPNNSYVYNYNGKNNGVTNISNIKWEVISGSISIIQGQGTNQVTLKFGQDFTTGKIKASSLVNNDYCENSLEISKL